jgi:hypothetical protein
VDVETRDEGRQDRSLPSAPERLVHQNCIEGSVSADLRLWAGSVRPGPNIRDWEEIRKINFSFFPPFSSST